MSVGNTPDKNDKWWKREGAWKVARKVYHPVLIAFSADYDRWTKERAPVEPKTLKESIERAEKTVHSFIKSSGEFIGFDDVVNELMSSVQYWVIEDKEFRELCPNPPPKVFILKGASGVGKTGVVHKVMMDAYNAGKAKNIPVFSSTISSHNIFNKWLGESEKMMAREFDVAFLRPSIIFIDEAHAMMAQMNNKSADDSGMAAYTSVQTTFLEKVSDLMDSDHKCILILATNEFGSLLNAVKRRGSSGTIDMDEQVTNDLLRNITESQIKKYKLKLNADDVFHTIEGKVRALGGTSVTPADVVNAFTIVMDKKTRELRHSYLKKFEQKVAGSSPEVTLLDFRDIKQLKEYSEDKRSDELKNIVQRIKPKITLADVGGLDGIKEKVLKDISIAMDYENSTREGATPIRGVLLYGTAGCGKTYLAQAIAGELNATLFIIKGAQLMKPYIGATEKLITDIFDEARKAAPSIVIIDEVDSLTMKRDIGGNLNAVTTLLSEMGGIKPLEGVVVVATTNKIQLVDEAFLRAGRFDRVVEIPPPRNDTERMEIIKIHMRKIQGILADEITPKSILDLMGKHIYTPARIERLVSDAVELRVKELQATKQLVQAIDGMDVIAQTRIRQLYREDIERVNVLLGGSPTSENYRAIIPENYKLTLNHFREALKLSKNEQVEEIQKFTQSLRGDTRPEVGKVYGLAAFGGEGSVAAEGMVAVVECVCNPNGEKGKSEVIGSEIAASIRASAEHARIFLNQESNWLLSKHEFYLDFITPMKGMDNPAISGPSAGAALALAELSSATNLKVLPNVVITGGITPKGEIIMVGGLDFRGMGKFVAALNTEGIDTIIIPKPNYDELSQSDKDFFQRSGLNVIPAESFWDVTRYALDNNPSREKILVLLEGNENKV